MLFPFPVPEPPVKNVVSHSKALPRPHKSIIHPAPLQYPTPLPHPLPKLHHPDPYHEPAHYEEVSYQVEKL